MDERVKHLINGYCFLLLLVTKKKNLGDNLFKFFFPTKVLNSNKFGVPKNRKKKNNIYSREKSPF